MEKQDRFDKQHASEVVEQQGAFDTEIEIEFIGTLEDITRGWTGPTDDFWDGDWTR